MTNHPNRTRRIWTTESGTVCLRDSRYDEDEIREFWVPSTGGFIYEIDDQHPGTLGSQVCEMLGTRGYTLTAHPTTLLDVIRSHYRKAIAYEKRWN